MTIESKRDFKLKKPIKQRVTRKMLNMISNDEDQSTNSKPFVRNKLHKRIHDQAFEEVIREIFVKSDKNRDQKLDM